MLVKVFLTDRGADALRVEQVRLCTAVWKSL